MINFLTKYGMSGFTGIIMICVSFIIIVLTVLFNPTALYSAIIGEYMLLASYAILIAGGAMVCLSIVYSDEVRERTVELINEQLNQEAGEKLLKDLEHRQLSRNRYFEK